MTKNRIYLSPPFMNGKEKEMLIEAFDSNWIAPLGPNVDAFENEIASYLGVEDCCALSSGTSALHLALRVANIKEGDFVVCPSFTFVASANIIMYEKAIPIFIDSDLQSWTMDCNIVEKVFKKYKPKAIIAVDIYGQSCDYEVLQELCKKYNVILIEDSAESLGSKRGDSMLGSFGEMGILSFNGNKIITTSGGGMLLSNNKRNIEKARYLASQARLPELYYEHIDLGFNYRMSNLLAAVGRGQLKNINQFIKKRRKIFNNYFRAFSNKSGIKFLEEAKQCKSNRWLTTLLIDKEKTGFSKDNVIEILQKENIESRPLWKPMHLQPLYKDSKYYKYKSFDVSAYLFKNGVCLPSGASLSLSDQNRIIDIIFSLF